MIENTLVAFRIPVPMLDKLKDIVTNTTYAGPRFFVGHSLSISVLRTDPKALPEPTEMMAGALIADDTRDQPIQTQQVHQ